MSSSHQITDPGWPIRAPLTKSQTQADPSDLPSPNHRPRLTPQSSSHQILDPGWPLRTPLTKSQTQVDPSELLSPNHRPMLTPKSSSPQPTDPGWPPQSSSISIHKDNFLCSLYCNPLNMVAFCKKPLTPCGLVMQYGKIENWINVDSGKGLLPDCIKPLQEPMFASHL